MAFTTLNLGLTLTIPTPGTRNWGQTLLQTTWTKISQHAHTGSGDGNQLGGASFADFTLTRDKFAKNIGFFPKASALTPSGTNQAIDFADGSFQVLDLDAATGDVSVSLTGGVAGCRYRLHIIQASTPWTVLWPSSVKWPQGQAAILSSTENAVDAVELFFDGTNYFADFQNDYL